MLLSRSDLSGIMGASPAHYHVAYVASARPYLLHMWHMWQMWQMASVANVAHVAMCGISETFTVALCRHVGITRCMLCCRVQLLLVCSCAGRSLQRVQSVCTCVCRRVRSCQSVQQLLARAERLLMQCSYLALRPLIDRYCPRDQPVLQVGVGLSKFQVPSLLFNLFIYFYPVVFTLVK